MKSALKELDEYIHPGTVRQVRMDGKVVERDTLRSVNAYLVMYTMIYVISLFIISFDDLDLVTNFTAVAATFNNIGPGLELVGATGNYSVYDSLSKLVLSFDMLAGRLEIFPMMILLCPAAWRRF